MGKCDQPKTDSPSLGEMAIKQIVKTIHQFFPDLYDQMNKLKDCRSRSEYELSEVLTSGINMFLLKEGSRNAFNLDRNNAVFYNNYEKVFKAGLPHMDTTDDLLRLLPMEELEGLKAELVGQLIEKRVFHQYKFDGKFLIAIDATGVVSFSEQHCENCLTQTSKNGNTSYFHNVLEAKLVCPNGASISIASEWIRNPDGGDYEKQDCELKAFTRLAKKMKKYFPRLPMLILADGLYPNNTFFNICVDAGWDFIVTFKDGNLKSLQEEIGLLPETAKPKHNKAARVKDTWVLQDYTWINGLEYGKVELQWVECNETKKVVKTGKEKQKRFVHLTNLDIDRETVAKISDTGRMRWKIENEGFNCQKNQGYEMQHQYSRVSFNALKNYYQCLQIAHMIGQLAGLSTEFKAVLGTKPNQTVQNIWKDLLATLMKVPLSILELDQFIKKRFQIRLA